MAWAEHPNEPLGAKHNAALRMALADPWDAVMILPSDDFVDPLYLVKAMDMVGRGADYIFPDSCGLYDVRTNRAVVLWQREMIGALKFGAGRILSRKAAEHIGELWTPGKGRGLDTDSHARILAHGYTPTVCGVGPGAPCLTDIKTGVNLWGFDKWKARGIHADPERVLCMIDVDTQAAIRALVP